MANTYQSKLFVETKPIDRALRLIDDGKFKEALDLIEDDTSSEALNVKGIIFENLGDYEKSVECFKKAENISGEDKFRLNRANCLYRWAKVTYFPEGNLDRAMDLIDEALESLPEGEDSSEFWFLKGEIYQSLENLLEARKCFLKAEGRLQELKILEDELSLFEKYGDETLINITGTGFYRGLEPFSENAKFRLVRDLENEHDPDAIAVMDGSEIVGYVANSDYTLIFDVKSASDIKNMIGESSVARVIFVFQNEYVIARVEL